MLNEETIRLLSDKLSLDTMDREIVGNFLAAILRYLDHGRKKDELKGRTTNFLETQLDKIISLYTAMGIDKEGIVKAITNFPPIINIANALYEKYLLLGVIENAENSVRKTKFVNNSKDLMIGLSSIYARYKLISYSGYNHYNWNSLVHSSEKEFAQVFTKGIYKKPYQVFYTIEQAYEWLNNCENDFDIEEFKNLDVNKDLVEKYEKREYQM